MGHLNKHMGFFAIAIFMMACSQGTVTQTGSKTGAVLSADEAAVLAFLNDPGTTFEVLDVDCAIRSDSANQLIKYRNGKDKTFGTADDQRFDSLAEVDDVAQVGPWTIDQIKVCADSFGYTPTIIELAVLEMLNHRQTDLEYLNRACGIHSDTARNLLAHRNGPDGTLGTADDNPFHSIEEVDSVDQVGPWNLDKLFYCAEEFRWDDAVTPAPDPGEAPNPDPGLCTPTAWDGTDPDDIQYVHSSNFTPELTARAAELLLDAPRFADPDRPFPVRFSEELEVWILNGEIVKYELRYLQMLDPEGGIQLHIVYELDSCLTVTDVYTLV